jgi:hypothetical protein
MSDKSPVGQFKQAVKELEQKVSKLDTSVPVSELVEKFCLDKTADILIIISTLIAPTKKILSIILLIVAKLLKPKEEES